MTRRPERPEQHRFIKCAACKEPMLVKVTGARINGGNHTATWLCEDATDCLDRQLARGQRT